jgi:transcriptional activator protein UGA3
MRLLVRQSLSLLEAMCDQDLPGYCSAHWVIFMTGVCAAASGQQQGELDDRERIDRLYDDFL